MSASRQLAAIMFTDIVGYTELMGHDEHKAFALLKKNRELQKPLIEAYGGRYIKELGDGTLASFSTVIDAVSCACSIIKGSADTEGLLLRIGIHLGDVIFENNDVFGDSVNIASRLQSLAPVGGIWISESVHKNISNKKGILSTFIREEVLKNVKDPVRIYEVDIHSFHPEPAERLVHTESAVVKSIEQANKKIFSPKKLLPWGATLIGLVLISLFLIRPWIKKQYARNKLIPAIQKLVDDNFRPPTEAYDMALEAEKYISKDSSLIKLWTAVSTTTSIETDPPGAGLFWKDYNTPDAPWRSVGITPLKDMRFPKGYLRMEFRKTGFQTIELAGPFYGYGKLSGEIGFLKLDSVGSLPENMVRIPKKKTDLYVIGLEQNGPKEVDEFLIDKYEVTNAQFKQFVDAGGYTNPSFWKYPIIIDGKEAQFNSAVLHFVDRTGRPGPANWEAGSYPDGLENHPVTGVSWFEAAAYAAYTQKELPTVFHWAVVAATSRTEYIVPLSNYNGKSTVPVGSEKNYSTYGVYDLAGNAREWCFNENKEAGQRYILGGGWNDPTYSFNDGYSQSPLDRSVANGFRCILELPGDTTMAGLVAPLALDFRDYKKEKPVDDKTFQIFLRQYSYDNKPLNEKTEATFEGEFWTAEKITFDAAYENDRVQLYLYLPKNKKGPFQPILFFPGSGDIYARKYDPQSITNRIDFLLKSGRAIIRPIYKGTFERFDDLKSDIQDESVFYRDHVIMWRKDIGRTLDYLATRADIQNDKVGYLGWSWGGFMGGIMPAVENRIKAVVLNVGGMEMSKALPEVDQINFLPHVTQPVLMLNGKHDMYFPVETSQEPMFNFLGTPKENKKKILYESGHLVPRTDFVKETLQWFDKYLGAVN
jgi:class 3 adenylate cyclase/dienelactone hydrolase